MSRQSTITPEVQEAVLEAMRTGESLRKACVAHNVSASSFLRMVDANKDLSVQYARAREDMLDAQAQELEDIGDQAARAQTAVEVNGLRLKADNRKWLLSKLAPKKYGDKLQLGGADDLPPIGVAKMLSDDELNAIAAKQVKTE